MHTGAHLAPGVYSLTRMFIKNKHKGSLHIVTKVPEVPYRYKSSLPNVTKVPYFRYI